MHKSKFSLYWTLQSDYLASLGVVLPLVSALLYLLITQLGFARGYDPLYGAAGAPVFFYLGLISLFGGVPLSYWRIYRVWWFFEHGVEALG